VRGEHITSAAALVDCVQMALASVADALEFPAVVAALALRLALARGPNSPGTALRTKFVAESEEVIFLIAVAIILPSSASNDLGADNVTHASNNSALCSVITAFLF